jgi:predicted HTH domain antitoxin
MTLHIPNDILKEAGLSEREALVEFSCRLFDAQKITFWTAAKLAGLDRGGMEQALLDRGLAIHRLSAEDLEQDLRTLEKWRK